MPAYSIYIRDGVERIDTIKPWLQNAVQELQEKEIVDAHIKGLILEPSQEANIMFNDDGYLQLKIPFEKRNKDDEDDDIELQIAEFLTERSKRVGGWD